MSSKRKNGTKIRPVMKWYFVRASNRSAHLTNVCRKNKEAMRFRVKNALWGVFFLFFAVKKGENEYTTKRAQNNFLKKLLKKQKAYVKIKKKRRIKT